MAITTAQIRGARGILNWSQGDLAKQTGISATSIGSIENGQSTPRANTLSTIQKAFEDAGIEFIGLEGVKQKTGSIRVFSGRMGFWDFYQDIYQTLKNNPGEVVVSNVDERYFQKFLGDDQVEIHIERMGALKGITYKILTKEGDTYFLASDKYAQYRWVPRAYFASVPFYVYDKKLAILLFHAEPTVIVLDYPMAAESYRLHFDAMWQNAIDPAAPQTSHSQ